MNICPTGQHTLYSYLTGWVKIPSSLVTYISCNTPYFCDNLRDIKSSKTKLPIIFKSLTSFISNLFKDTENPFHILVLSFSFLYLFNVGTLKHFEDTPTDVVSYGSVEIARNGCALLQFEPPTVNIYFEVPWRQHPCLQCNFSIRRKKIDDHYRWSAPPHSIQIILLV